MMASGLLLDSQYWPVLRFANDHKVLFIRSSLVWFISKERLQCIIIGNQKKDPLLVEEMASIIERHFQLQGAENIENIDSSDVVYEDTVQTYTAHTYHFRSPSTEGSSK